MSYLFNNQVQVKGTDAFSRIRVSEGFTLAEYNHVYGDGPEMLIVASGSSATSSNVANQAARRLSVGTQSGTYIIEQSRMYHHYVPGKSQYILSSFVYGTYSTGASKKCGYFDDYNGIYFNQDGSGNLSFRQRSYVTGTVVEESFTQSFWNVDKCDGTGASGFNLDISKTQLVFFDYQWLGVGRIRCGFVHNGENVVAHEIYHSNNLSTVYWSNPNLPIRCEVRRDSDGNATASMDQICASVMSEGGYEGVGIDFSVAGSTVSLIDTTTLVPALAIKLKSTFNGYPNRGLVRLNSIDLLGQDNSFKYEIWRLNATASVTGGAWVDNGTDSIVQYNITATSSLTTTGGIRVASGFVAATSTTGGGATKTPGADALINVSASKRNFIANNFDCTDSQIYVIAVQAITLTGGSCNLRVSAQWREIK
jgi:hypothetical protein